MNAQVVYADGITRLRIVGMLPHTTSILVQAPFEQKVKKAADGVNAVY